MEPHQNLIAQFEAMRSQPKIFQDELSGNMLDGIAKERVDIMGAHVNLLIMSSQRNPKGVLESSGVDELDGDILDPEFMDSPAELDHRKIDLPCLIEHTPTKQMLKKFGIDELREVIFHFPFATLKEKGLVTERRFRGIDIGDLIEWDGTFYVTLNVHRGTYFGQSDRFFFTSSFTNRYRLDSSVKV
jgi:hypothetical protein